MSSKGENSILKIEVCVAIHVSKINGGKFVIILDFP